jgi:transcriptional regulator with XRE-family HTH domain
MAYQRDLEGLGRFIRERRKALGLTQAALGSRLDWSQERVSVMEHGKYGLPSLPRLCRLAERARRQGQLRAAERFDGQAKDGDRNALLLRQVLQSGETARDRPA